MAKVSLREYIREINSLIEDNHIREAKEHCAHILKSYPKYIDIYRMLGKAHLESQRYDEAKKIFTRVLSVLPDDFVSHLGLSVVEEEQDNLDGAIWHMERAYELKSTQTIHEELHRLFTLRDGVAPPKPLITRGALIRINVRSGLYQQALKEIDLALKEDPQRLDLEILRAQIYFQQKNFPLAIRYCKSILQKHPYVYDANLLMTEIAATPEQAEPFKQKMFELDPYTSLVDEHTNLDNVPADAIKIDYLEIPMISVDQNQPEQTQDSRIELEETPLLEQTIIDEEKNPPDPIMDSTILETNSHENAQIPDWMKQMGWEAGEQHTADEEQALIHEYDTLASMDDNTILDESGQIEETDIPDWLKDLEPQQEDQPQDTIEEEDDDDDWLNNIFSENKDQNNAVESIPSDHKQQEQTTPMSSNVPEFGEDLEADQEWLEKISSPNQQLLDPNEQSPDRPSRMPKPEDMMDFSFDEPDDDDEMLDKENINQGSDEEPEDIDSAIAWLEGLAAKQGAEEEVLFSPVESREEKPAWLESGEEEDDFEDDTEFDEPAYIIDEQENSFSAEFDPDSLFEDITEEDDVVEPELVEEDKPVFGSPESLEENDDADVPEWLKTIAPPESVDFEEEPTETVDDQNLEYEIPEELGSLFYDSEEQSTENAEPQFEDALDFDEQYESFEDLSTSDEPQEDMASTAVLDFIKQEVNNDIDEIDSWLKGLPDQDNDEEEVQEEASTPQYEQSSSDREDIPPMPENIASLEDNSPVEFIDDYFSEEVETSPIQSEDNQEPYQWEQEFEETPEEENDLPDWIAGIEEEDDALEPELTPEIPAEIQQELDEDTGIPDWMTMNDVVDEGQEDFSPEQYQDEQEEAFIEKPVEETFIEAVEEEFATSPEEVQEEPNITSDQAIDFEEVFLIAKNKLHNGDFDEAFSQLYKLLEQDVWVDRVMNAVIHDIENYHPIEVESWVLLGDAYSKQDRLKEALEAYTKAESFIK